MSVSPGTSHQEQMVMRSHMQYSVAMSVLGTIVAAVGLAAQGLIEPIRPVPNGRIEKLRSAVQVDITGRVARVTVEEWFRNSGPVMDEGSYLYPLPGEAVFNDFSLWQGDRELKGEMMDAAAARAIYESIVRRKRDPALIELQGRGLLRARVFPINPGETRKITLRYTQLLDRVGDAWRFRFPKDITPVPRSFHVAIDSAAQVRDPYSPTHQLTTSRQGNRIDVTLADSNATGELELILPSAQAQVGVSVTIHRVPGEPDGYFMALLTPGQIAVTHAVQRDVAAVLDISGSMSGEKLDQAKAALLQLLGTLRAGDRFRLIAFSSVVRPQAAGWTEATSENVARARDWVRGLTAEGGTNIAGALGEAFATPPGEGALGVVIFLTDGLPTVGETDPERIAAQAEQSRGALRVFAFGLGYDVNSFLLDRLTERARGATEYVTPGANIERAVGTLAAKIASPVLTDLTLSGDGAELYDLQPTRLPDLFAGEDLLVFGRYRRFEAGSWGVTVTGRRGGRTERFATTVSDAGAGLDGRDYVTQLWAARKAGALTREVRLHGATPEVMNELKNLALRYGVLTEYTSYLVQEPGAVAVERPDVRPAAPEAQVGAPSIAQARREAASASAKSANDALELDRASMAGLRDVETQRAGNKLFVLRDSVWTDLASESSKRLISVAPFSDAYFALLAALPELVRPAALEPAVLVAGRHVNVKIAMGGVGDWRTGELEQIVREFRN